MNMNTTTTIDGRSSVIEEESSESIVNDAIAQLAKRANKFVNTNINNDTTAIDEILNNVGSHKNASHDGITLPPKETITNTLIDEIIDAKTGTTTDNIATDIVEASDDEDSKNNIILNTPMISNVNNNNDNDAVDTWKRRMKIQALALQEAEDALERAEGEIQLANEINYQKNTNQDNNYQNVPDNTMEVKKKQEKEKETKEIS
eukprot:g13764.t1